MSALATMCGWVESSLAGKMELDLLADSVLDQSRLDAPEFCERFNELTQLIRKLELLCVKVYVYSDGICDLMVNAPASTCLARRMFY